ncbi:hypothetical protein ACF07F_00350 [Streptomyces sp. NPDC015237]|uniref:hypothetical protein n=1 Tax=Streptomyces sp. NPDC015237 TaxID=3364949 RepID=UPI0037004172
MTSSAGSSSAVLPASSAEPPPIWFLAPEGFFALPLADGSAERAERAESFVRQLYSRGDEEVWNPAAPVYATLAERIGDTGVSYAALGLFSTSEVERTTTGDVARHDLSGGAAQCAFTLAAVPTDHEADATDVVAQGIVATLSKDTFNDVQWLDLPCGPAVSCVTWRQYQLNPEVTATGEPTDLVTAEIQVHVPFPTGPFTAVFTLVTASVDQWTEFVDMMAGILQTISFTDPAEALAE